MCCWSLGCENQFLLSRPQSKQPGLSPQGHSLWRYSILWHWRIIAGFALAFWKMFGFSFAFFQKASVFQIASASQFVQALPFLHYLGWLIHLTDTLMYSIESQWRQHPCCIHTGLRGSRSTDYFFVFYIFKVNLEFQYLANCAQFFYSVCSLTFSIVYLMVKLLHLSKHFFPPWAQSILQCIFEYHFWMDD